MFRQVIQYLKKMDGRVYWLFFSLLFAVGGTMTKAFFWSSFTNNKMSVLQTHIITTGNVFLFICLFIVAYAGMRSIYIFLCRRGYDVIDRKKSNGNVIFGQSFLINLFVWSIWLFTYFPGAGMNDTINGIISPDASLLPFLYRNILYYTIHGLTAMFGSMTTAYAIIVIIHMLFFSLSIAWVLGWLEKRNVHHTLLLIIMAYYAFSPVIGDYSITLVKDGIFGILILLLLPMVSDIIDSNGLLLRKRKNFLCFLAVVLGILAVRSNGPIVIEGVLLGLLLCIRNRKQVLILGVIAVLSAISLSALEHASYGEDSEFRESVSVPLVQIAAVLNSDDAKISEEDRQFLNSILPVDEWKDCYEYSFVDRIKFSGSFNMDFLNQNKGEFIAVWSRVLMDNLPVYIRAYIGHTYGFWNMSPIHASITNFSQSLFRKINNNTVDESLWGNYCLQNNLRNIRLMPEDIYTTLDSFLALAFYINLLFSPGIMFWVVIGGAFLILSCHEWRNAFCFSPLFITWITLMVASPASFIYRYSFYLTLSMPVVVMIVIFSINKRIKEANRK